MSPARRDQRGVSGAGDTPAGSQSLGARPEPRKPSPRAGSGRPSQEKRRLAPLAIASAAAVLLLWNLTDTYLWQDEANTAVLTVRLLEHGSPLAYDGRNLLSDDNFSTQDKSTIDERTKDPEKEVQDCIRRGSMTKGGMWTYHPWGQFVLAGLSIKLLGQTTLAARLPFALAGLATLFALYWLLWRYLRSELIATLACALLTLNVYWLLHSRQARYYPLTGLFFVLTLIAYGRWQQGVRWGAAVFVGVAWCWFQVDYGTVWPVFGVLFIDAFVRALQTHWKSAWKPLATGLALAATIAPFIVFYRLTSRQSGLVGTWLQRFKGALFNINEYVVPMVVVLAALVLVVIRWRRLPPFESRLIVLACAMVVALSFWVATVAPMTYVRYVIMAAPVGAMLTAWLFVRVLGSYASRWAWLACAVVALTPWLCKPLTVFRSAKSRPDTGTVLRSELSLIRTDIFEHRLDPNRLVIEWLQKHSTPADEILVNYEDLPMMYYLPNLIRGGVVAFRAEDDRVTPPRFVVLRRTVPFVHWPVFAREIARYYWSAVPLKAPDIRWGNNPDPDGHLQDRTRAPDLLFFERREPTGEESKQLVRSVP